MNIRPTPYALPPTPYPPRPTILITGARGMLGQKLKKVLERECELVLTDREEMDITDAKKVTAVISKVKPAIVIHAAAYVDVDRAEDEKKLCRQINVEGTRNVASAAAKVGATIIYISTDYVFDGIFPTSHVPRPTPYKEIDPPHPLSVYGRSKLDGEKEVIKHCRKYYILRIAWLFGENTGRKNFVETMIALAGKNKAIKAVNDRIGSPTYTGDVAKIIRGLLGVGSYGLYHFSGVGETTHFKFAKEIFRQLKLKADLKSISTNEFPTKAKRPVYSYLDKTKIEKVLKTKTRPWEKMLGEYLRNR